jgi:hypothetical protein
MGWCEETQLRLAEIKRLFEEPIQTVAAEDLWSENSSSSAQYITTTVYLVKPVPDKSDMFEVSFDKDGQRQVYGTMNQEDLDAAFAPIRPNQEPDAEGYLTYRSADVFDAIKYAGDPVKVTLDSGPETTKLNTGDYLLRQDGGNDFTYTVERANYFDNDYVKK